ncbi:MAG: hypothetical protein A2946_03935 [Candidatus Liptonbacteria bacterium RIFCSPLOWO2_01_FULL_53_13]|uniref:Uncharacterized protein n=1 Tax=Candidatus Liptonbacteria bacterium RIFCSPLOWO2_01_FULL_53_13 TaxID=1798651 RepID=A0A1G2CHK4_9BACT|nr:MAG: hypothetical protein A2946_03935 [Candidatus Liptonbacteria bacterium RIFCSPLOWO2_01_FULL_53_13]
MIDSSKTPEKTPERNPTREEIFYAWGEAEARQSALLAEVRKAMDSIPGRSEEETRYLLDFVPRLEKAREEASECFRQWKAALEQN